MTKLSNSDNDSGGKTTEERPPGMPRWVRVSLIIVITLILLFVIINLTGIGGKHGPMRHFSYAPLTENIEVLQP